MDPGRKDAAECGRTERELIDEESPSHAAESARQMTSGPWSPLSPSLSPSLSLSLSAPTHPQTQLGSAAQLGLWVRGGREGEREGEREATKHTEW